MILLVLAAATVSGLSVVMVKLFGEFIQSRSLSEHTGLGIAIVILLMLFTVYQVHLLNFAMKYYD